MPQSLGKPIRSKAQILAQIDRQLPQLPHAQQNLVAAYARGISAGLSLSASLAPSLHTDAPKRRERT